MIALDLDKGWTSVLAYTDRTTAKFPAPTSRLLHKLTLRFSTYGSHLDDRKCVSLFFLDNKYIHKSWLEQLLANSIS